MASKSKEQNELVGRVSCPLSPDQFKAILKQKGWTYRSLASWWGVSLVWTNKIINNENRPLHFDDALMGLPYRRFLRTAQEKREKVADTAMNRAKGKTRAHSGELRYKDYLTVGTILVAAEDVGSIAPAGMKGVIFATKESRQSAEYGVIFENGVFDWFMPEFIDQWFSETGIFLPGLAGYAFKGEHFLTEDFEKGLFDAIKS